MDKNKPGTFLERYLNRQQIKKHRKLSLKINYLKGLTIENDKKFDQYIEKETKLIEGYYLEDLKPLKDLLFTESKNDSIRNKLIAKFDEKAYWQRRKLKTKLTKINSEQLNEQLDTFDLNTKNAKSLFLETLDKKYPKDKLDKNEISIITARIETLKQEKASHLDKMNHKGSKIKTKYLNRNKKNQLLISSYEQKHQIIQNNITKFNSKRQLEDEKLLSMNTDKLISLKNDKINGKNVSFKQIEKLEKTVAKIETVKHALEDESIHLSIKGLKMFFGGVKAVNDLTFDVKRGEIFGLIGPNGAGKTTVFNCITQFYKATDGQMIFRNKDNHVVDLYELKTHDMISEGIARSFQNVELIWELTVLDNLMVAAHSLLITSFIDHMAHTPKLLREEAVIRTKGYQILKDLGIEAYAFRSPYGLPYGVLKKIELARTLMTNPTLIILDEPAAGLNDAETESLAEVIKKINKDYGITIFLVEHDMGLVMSICDTICAISFGKRIGLGTPKEIQSNEDVRKAYLGDDDDE